MDKELTRIIERELETTISTSERVFGGDINTTYVLRSSTGTYFLKLNSSEKHDMFEKEFLGLSLLRTAATIHIPTHITTGKWDTTIYLVMEYVEKGTAGLQFWEIFGKQLAELHRNSRNKFGLDHDNYIGSLLQRNTEKSNWSEFYAENRILFLTKRAFDERKLDSSDIRLAEKLCNKLDSLFPKEEPSLLHGDLWNGNFMVGPDGNPVIYDPSVYYGHREMDLGMSLLFGGFDKSFYSFYNEAWSLELGWQQRVDLTQLYPLLVHLVLFGGHYYQSVRTTLRKYG